MRAKTQKVKPNQKPVIEVDGELFIPFKWKDDTPGGRNLGRAEFQVCLKTTAKDGIKEFWVDAAQQYDMPNIWHCICNNSVFTVQSYGALENPNVWMFSYCRLHHCTSFRVYTPDNAEYLRISYDGISFHKEKW